jgi:precorrin-2 dehydrogenase/sirohydrochlorin ferrochelatase
MLDVTRLTAVIVGGGGVAARKARGLIEAGCPKIRMISPTFHEDVPTAVEKITARFAPAHLDDANLVFAATDSPDVNDAVVREARRRNLLVSRSDSDDDTPGDFTTPAMLRKGPITITVTTGGSPALAATIRDEIANRFDPRWRDMAEAMLTIRPAVMTTNKISPDRRREAFIDLATPEALHVLDTGGAEQLWRWLVERYPELK